MKGNRKSRRSLLLEIKLNGPLYLLALPGFVLLTMFSYAPMVGLLLVFKNYNFKGGIFGSPWASPLFSNFTFFFHNFDKAIRAVRNTVGLNILFFIVGSVTAITIAIILAELTSKLFIKFTQSIMFFPYFISWTVIGCILTTTVLTYKGGFLNGIITALGGRGVDFFSNPVLWIPILVFVNTWQSAGYSSIIYYAVLSGTEVSYYEAAMIDGASKWQQIIHISLPVLKPTFIILFLLSVGMMLRGNLAMIVGLTNLNPSLLDVTDIIDVYVYRSSIMNGEMAFSSAISLFQSVFGFVLVIASNALVKKADASLALF